MEFHTGNVTVKNNTDKDIYFYYHFQGIYGLSPKFIKVKVKSSKTINSLISGQYSNSNKEQYQYAWKATFELQENRLNIQEMEGIESGDFIVTDCGSTEIEVDN